MIRVKIKEYRDGNFAVKTTEVTFLCAPIFKYKKTTTNNLAVELLTEVTQPVKIKGFNETEN